MNSAQVLERYWDGVLPVKPILIANRMGISVFESSYTLVDTSAVIGYKDGDLSVTYKTNENILRKRFIVARTIARLALNILPDEYNERYSDYLLTAKFSDRKLNNFASEILVPSQTLSFCLTNLCKTDNLFQELCEMHEVSGVLMQKRLGELGFLRG